MDYQQQLYGSWRACGLSAAPSRDDPHSITFVCPRCEHPKPLTVDASAANGTGAGLVVSCPDCDWTATGYPWEIAAAARAVSPEQVAADGLPPLVAGHEIAAKSIVLPDELISGMLHTGSKMVLGGGSKSFKTWCLADLGISLSTGRRWWGREVKQGKVCYLNLEVQPQFFEYRLQKIAEAKGCSLPSALSVWHLRGHCADHRVLLPTLTERLKGEEYAAVILDPTYKVMNGSENAQEEVAALMDSIEKLGAATGAAVIFGSHFAKGNAAGKEAIDRISGSGVFARDPDAILTMTRHEEEDAFVVDAILRNCPSVPAFGVRWRFPLMESAPDLDVFALKQPGAPKKPVPSAEQVGATVAKKGGSVEGGVNNPGGLVKQLQVEFGTSRDGAQQAIESALGKTIETGIQHNPHGQPKRIYILKKPTNVPQE